MNVGLLAFAFDYGGVFLVDGNALGSAEVFQLHVLELDPEIFRDATTAGQHRDVFQHRLATIAEARGLDRANLQGPAQLVHHQSGERFAFHIFRDDQERTTSLGYFLKQREHVLQARDFLLVNEDVRIFEHGLHRFRVGDEVGREITFVELHTFDYVQE